MKFTEKWGSGRHPGEPLYTLDEIADRLGTTREHVRGLMTKHPGLVAWQTHGRGVIGGPQRNQYRLSDAKRWWAGIQEKSK